MSKKQEKSNENLKSNDVVSDLIQSNNEYEKIKVLPKNRWFNSILVILLAIIGIMVGITFGCILIIIFL